MIRKIILGVVVAVILSLLGLLATGDYVYRIGTAVYCGHHPYHEANFPDQFFVPGLGQGPFKGIGWDRWVGTDLSEWWLPAGSYERVRFSSIDQRVELEAWWIPSRANINGAAVVVTHGINTSRKDFNTLLPAVMLSRSGLNVLLMDLRDSGGSTCEDGRHSAGQSEATDLLSAAYWLRDNHGIPLSGIGIHGVSGGAIAALVLAATNDQVAAFSLEAPIFDFNEAAKQEVIYQGFPGFLWYAAYWAARIRGVDLRAIEPRQGVAQLNGRPLQVFHGTDDSRVKFKNSVDLEAFAKHSGVSVKLYSIADADHTEGILLDTDLYYQALESFFFSALVH